MLRSIIFYFLISNSAWATSSWSDLSNLNFASVGGDSICWFKLEFDEATNSIKTIPQIGKKSEAGITCAFSKIYGQTNIFKCESAEINSICNAEKSVLSLKYNQDALWIYNRTAPVIQFKLTQISKVNSIDGFKKADIVAYPVSDSFDAFGEIVELYSDGTVYIQHNGYYSKTVDVKQLSRQIPLGCIDSICTGDIVRVEFDDDVTWNNVKVLHVFENKTIGIMSKSSPSQFFVIPVKLAKK